MTWTYSQTTGEFLLDGEFVGTGYSGRGEGRDDAQAQNLVGLGPLPQGQYRIGPPRTDAQLGPMAFPLTALSGNMYGRSGFFIHGNNRENDASHGCLVLGPSIRAKIAASPDRQLTVTA